MTNRNLSVQTRDSVSRLARTAPALQAAQVTATSYPSHVTVNLAGGIIDALCVGGQFPAVKDVVMILQIDQTYVCLGAIPKPAHGVVTAAASGGKVQVKADDTITYTLNYNHLYTPAVNDHVKIDWDIIGGFVVGPMAAAPTGDPNLIAPDLPPSSEPTGPTTHVSTFQPTDSGTWNGYRYWTTEVYCGDSSYGAYFYGTQIADTIPDGATINGIAVWLNETANYVPGAPATLGTHTLLTPSGYPGTGNAVQIPDGTGWKNLPVSFGALLGSGAAYGLATNHGGYHIYSPKGVGNSGTLSITWTG